MTEANSTESLKLSVSPCGECEEEECTTPLLCEIYLRWMEKVNADISGG